MNGPNDEGAIRRRLDAGALTWRGPAVMLFARSACAVGAQALVAGIFALRSSPRLDAAPWLPVYGTLIDGGCLALTEQMTYNGYLVSRFQMLCRSTSLAVALVGFSWSFQHVVMPLTFDTRFMVFRLLSPVPFSVFQTLLYLRLRRLVPFAIAHAVMDGASVLIGVLFPLLRA